MLSNKLNFSRTFRFESPRNIQFIAEHKNVDSSPNGAPYLQRLILCHLLYRDTLQSEWVAEKQNGREKIDKWEKLL